MSAQPHTGIWLEESEHEVSIGNSYLARRFSTENKHLATLEITNYRSGSLLAPSGCNEFAIHLTDGTSLDAHSCMLKSWEQKEHENGCKSLLFHLNDDDDKWQIVLEVYLMPDDFYMRKRLTVTCAGEAESAQIERFDLESLEFKAFGGHLPIDTFGDSCWWKRLGQPVFTPDMFFGVEFPAADNCVNTLGHLRAGYDWGRCIGHEPYQTWSCVCGAGRHSREISSDFLEYVERVRIHSPRFFCQYNSWWDDTRGIDCNEAKMLEVADSIDKHFDERQLPPLDSFQIDHGWQELRTGFWDADTERFPGGLSNIQTRVKKMGSRLGLWIGPMGGWGDAESDAGQFCEQLHKDGFEMLDSLYSERRILCLAGPHYVDALTRCLVKLMKEHGINSWKFDGFVMNGMTCSDPEHGHPVGKEGRYYITAFVEAWIRLLQALRQENPDVFLNITSCAWLSPWFLMYGDTVYLNNCEDQLWEGEGGDRDRQLTYRDARFYEVFKRDRTQFPLSSIYCCDIIKQSIPYCVNESPEEFRNYVFMCMARGHQLVELGIAPSVMTEAEWDILAEALKWKCENFAAVSKAIMIGGNPAAGQVYGYSGWTAESGFVALRNPLEQAQEYHLCFDRTIGILPGSGTFTERSIVSENEANDLHRVATGEIESIVLRPLEVRLLEYTTC